MKTIRFFLIALFLIGMSIVNSQTNLAIDGQVSSNNTIAAYPPDLAVDGDNGTRWATNTGNATKQEVVTTSAPAGGSSFSPHYANMSEWQDDKFGFFCHWGGYAMFNGTYQGVHKHSAEWVQENFHIPWGDYSDKLKYFNPYLFDAAEWVNTIKSAGMKYMVITAKHHDGFAMFDSDEDIWDYNIMDWTLNYTGPDPMAALKSACDSLGLKFGVYYSPGEFRAFRNDPVNRPLGPEPNISDYDLGVELSRKMHGQVKELVQNYQPAIMWADGINGLAPEYNMDDLNEFKDILDTAGYKIIINNRFRSTATGKADVADTTFATFEGKIPTTFQNGPWEACDRIGYLWGYGTRSTLHPDSTGEPYIHKLVEIVALGGNYLLNVGPDPLGQIPAWHTRIMGEIGDWLIPNGQAIYNTREVRDITKPSWGYLTGKTGRLYLIVDDTQWPGSGNKLTFEAISNSFVKAYRLLDANKTPLTRTVNGGNWEITVTGNADSDDRFTVIVLEISGFPTL